MQNEMYFQHWSFLCALTRTNSNGWLRRGRTGRDFEEDQYKKKKMVGNAVVQKDAGMKKKLERNRCVGKRRKTCDMRVSNTKMVYKGQR